MHGRFARSSFTGSAEELARQVEEGMLPILQSSPGFKAYSVAEASGDIYSFSAWESAEAADAAIASWVTETIPGRVQLKQRAIGEIHIATALGVSTKAGISA
ncbi:MAG TPA: hypothetical protein VK896_04035 [Gaiellaceae bacterium]|nr:hypothetical protein [Gaiellaceae bacterium]